MVRFTSVVLVCIGGAWRLPAQSVSQQTGQPATVHVDITPGRAINSFNPDRSLGSSVDVLSHRDIDLVYTPHIN